MGMEFHSEQKLYDFYLAKLNPKSPFSKALVEYNQNNSSTQIHDMILDTDAPTSISITDSTSKPTHSRITEAERARIRAKYDQKKKQRRFQMYQQAILLAEEKEKEEGRKHRSQRTLQLSVRYNAYFGQNVHVVGSIPSLGCWDPHKSIPLKWTPGNVWTCTIVASTDDGVVEYKYITIDDNTNAVQWEQCLNHKIDFFNISDMLSSVSDYWGMSN